MATLTETLPLRIDPTTKALLKGLADKESRTVSNMMRVLVHRAAEQTNPTATA
jgi:uncharacterized protein (DUF1778 family)